MRYAEQALTAVGVVERATPATLMLFPFSPNPLRDLGTVEFELPMASRVRLPLYGSGGHRASTLADGLRDAGRNTIRLVGRGLEFRGGLPWLEAGRKSSVRRVVVFSWKHAMAGLILPPAGVVPTRTL